MNAEFNVWLLIVGLIVGAGLIWVVMLDGRRGESEIDAIELPREAAWLAAVLSEDGYDVSAEAAEQLLLLHRAYLAAPPPDAVADEERSDDGPPDEWASGANRAPREADFASGAIDSRAD